MICFRVAVRDDVPAVVALLQDDSLGASRETAGADDYLAAFGRMQAEGANHLIVGEQAGRARAPYPITFLLGPPLRATDIGQHKGRCTALL